VSKENEKRYAFEMRTEGRRKKKGLGARIDTKPQANTKKNERFDICT